MNPYVSCVFLLSLVSFFHFVYGEKTLATILRTFYGTRRTKGFSPKEHICDTNPEPSENLTTYEIYLKKLYRVEDFYVYFFYNIPSAKLSKVFLRAGAKYANFHQWKVYASLTINESRYYNLRGNMMGTKVQYIILDWHPEGYVESVCNFVAELPEKDIEFFILVLLYPLLLLLILLILLWCLWMYCSKKKKRKRKISKKSNVGNVEEKQGRKSEVKKNEKNNDKNEKDQAKINEKEQKEKEQKEKRSKYKKQSEKQEEVEPKVKSEDGMKEAKSEDDKKEAKSNVDKKNAAKNRKRMSFATRLTAKKSFSDKKVSREDDKNSLSAKLHRTETLPEHLQ